MQVQFHSRILINQTWHCFSKLCDTATGAWFCIFFLLTLKSSSKSRSWLFWQVAATTTLRLVVPVLNYWTFIKRHETFFTRNLYQFAIFVSINRFWVEFNSVQYLFWTGCCIDQDRPASTKLQIDKKVKEATWKQWRINSRWPLCRSTRKPVWNLRMKIN